MEESMIIGYCKCAKCGWTDGKFNWHVLFKCPNCGCREYKKWRSIIEDEQEMETESERAITDATDDHCFTVDFFIN